MRVNNDKRRLEATAIVMLGVIGAEFGADLESFDANTRSTYKRTSRANSRTLVWHTSKFVKTSDYHLCNDNILFLCDGFVVENVGCQSLGTLLTVYTLEEKEKSAHASNSKIYF